MTDKIEDEDTIEVTFEGCSGEKLTSEEVTEHSDLVKVVVALWEDAGEEIGSSKYDVTIRLKRCTG